MKDLHNSLNNFPLTFSNFSSSFNSYFPFFLKRINHIFSQVNDCSGVWIQFPLTSPSTVSSFFLFLSLYCLFPDIIYLSLDSFVVASFPSFSTWLDYFFMMLFLLSVDFQTLMSKKLSTLLTAQTSDHFLDSRWCFCSSSLLGSRTLMHWFFNIM